MPAKDFFLLACRTFLFSKKKRLALNPHQEMSAGGYIFREAGNCFFFAEAGCIRIRFFWDCNTFLGEKGAAPQSPMLARLHHSGHKVIMKIKRIIGGDLSQQFHTSGDAL
jgi:hypothetical protein